MNWTELQNRIALSYCGTVLMLDDEICTDIDRNGINPLFTAAKLAFEAKGMLCDLRHIVDDFEDQATVSAIKSQLRRADTVVVDWYLGAGKDQQQDPTNALLVLKELSAMGGFRFVIIHSKANPDDVVNRLREEFSECFSEATHLVGNTLSDDDDTEVVAEGETVNAATLNQAPSTYKLAQSLYASVIEKAKPPMLAADVPAFFINGLKTAFPDHLHWAGLEFAARARESLPALLGSLPIATDIALVFQALVQQRQDELADCIAECLVQEMRQMLSDAPLAAVQDETLIERLGGGVIQNIESIKTSFRGKPTDWTSAWKDIDCQSIKSACVEDTNRRLPEEFGIFFPADKDKNAGYDSKQAPSIVSKFVGIALGQKNNESVIQSHEAYASLREHLQCAKPVRLEPGVVLRRIQTENPLGESLASQSEWLLCISPACDCARGSHTRRYLFVGGRSDNKPGKMQTCIRIGDVHHHVKWLSAEFQIFECSPSGPHLHEMTTKLHDAFLQRLIQSVWGHQTRVGVSTSDFVRKQRGE